MKLLKGYQILFFSTILIFVFLPYKTLATEGEIPFGGFSLYVLKCTCSRNYLIIHSAVAGPSPIVFDDFFSKQYDFNNVKRSGVWLLGNVSSPVACRVWIGDDCVTIGHYPLITIVGTSDPAKLAHSNNIGSSNSTNSNGNNSEQPENQSNNGQTTILSGEGSKTPAENGKTEAQTRANLASHGVAVDPDLSPTLSPVSKLPNNAIAGAEDLAEDCGPNCNVMITSGARQEGNAVAPGEHGTGKPVFDLNKDPGLDNYIQNNASRNYTNSAGTHYIMPNGDEYLDENYGNTGGTGAHWHVRINADHMNQTA